MRSRSNTRPLILVMPSKLNVRVRAGLPSGSIVDSVPVGIEP